MKPEIISRPKIRHIVFPRRGKKNFICEHKILTAEFF